MELSFEGQQWFRDFLKHTEVEGGRETVMDLYFLVFGDLKKQCGESSAYLGAEAWIKSILKTRIRYKGSRERF